jgi:hexosaminidase
MYQLTLLLTFMLIARHTVHLGHFLRLPITKNLCAHKINRLGGDVAPKVVAAGLRCIVSNQDKWYLDHLDATWEEFYMNEPLKGIDNPEQQRLVIGGEVCMWGEQIDASDIEQTIWPRAAAAAGQ